MIFGMDNRILVASPGSGLPTSMIVRVNSVFPNGTTTVATGTLIGNNDVLTAGHVVFAPEFGGWATSIRVTFPGGAPLHSAGSIVAHPDYVADPFDFSTPDIGLIQLLLPLIDGIPLPLGALPSNAAGLDVVSFGYPADKGGVDMWRTSGTIDGFAPHLVFHYDDFDAAGGQSGSPLLFGGSIVGVYAFDDVGGAPPHNGSVRLTDELIALVNFWRSTNDSTDGPDLLIGSVWDEAWIGLAGNDTITAMDGNDSVIGAQGDDDVNGNRGADLVYGDEGADFVRGGQDNDRVYGGAGSDWHVNGNMGEDSVFGDAGDDTVLGGQGNDHLFGGSGDDWIDGNLGDDVMTGGNGADTFVFGPGRNTIADFDPTEDRIVTLTYFPAVLAAAGGVAVGVWDDEQTLVMGATIEQVVDRLIWLHA